MGRGSCELSVGSGFLVGPQKRGVTSDLYLLIHSSPSLDLHPSPFHLPGPYLFAKFLEVHEETTGKANEPRRLPVSLSHGVHEHTKHTHNMYAYIIQIDA